MRLMVVSSFFILLFFGASAQPFPRKAADVVPIFYQLYDVGNLSFPKIQWEKRNHSWYVYEINLDSGQSVHLNLKLFYNADTGNFIPLNYQKRDTGTVKEDVNTLLNGDVYNFDIQPSYGYAGWYNDVIRDYGDVDTLTINETYGLARAYSAAANARLNDQFGNAVTSETFTQALRPNCLSEAQVDEYLSLCEKAIKGFETVASRNANFETRVGNIAQKAANEWLVAYHHVLVYAKKYLYKVSLPENLYEPKLLDTVRARLAGCPRQAILLSFGDNDFYPVLYLQAKGIRQDVYLININLMGLDRHIYSATRQPWFRSKPITTSFDTIHYKGDRNLYRLLDTASPIDMAAIVRAIKQLPETYHLPSNRWRIRGARIKSGLKRHTITIPTYYVLKQDIVLLDVLDRLQGRKFCITSPFDEQLIDLNRLFFWNGRVFVYRN